MKRVSALSVGSALVVAVVLATSPAASARTKFSSCEDLHRVYSNGISKSSAAANLAVHSGSRRPIIAPRVYRNSAPSLDADQDGTMCEVPRT